MENRIGRGCATASPWKDDVKKYLFPLCLVTAVYAASPSYAIDYNTGLEAYKSGKYAVALQHWGSLAAQGEPRAQFAIGLIYDKGKGVRQNKETAVNWYRKAAEGGLPRAQYSMGMRHARGEGVTQNLREALMWFRVAEANGYAKASEACDAVEAKMSAVDIHEAEIQAQAWLAIYKK